MSESNEVIDLIKDISSERMNIEKIMDVSQPLPKAVLQQECITHRSTSVTIPRCAAGNDTSLRPLTI